MPLATCTCMLHAHVHACDGLAPVFVYIRWGPAMFTFCVCDVDIHILFEHKPSCTTVQCTVYWCLEGWGWVACTCTTTYKQCTMHESKVKVRSVDIYNALLSRCDRLCMWSDTCTCTCLVLALIGTIVSTSHAQQHTFNTVHEGWQ